MRAMWVKRGLEPCAGGNFIPWAVDRNDASERAIIMDQSRSAAERVRPILQAMERSIEAARRRRLHESQGFTRPGPVPASPTTTPDAPLPRLKARPKRPPMMGSRDATSQAI